MNALLRWTIGAAALGGAVLRAQDSPAARLPTGEVHFITVDTNVKLEVVDWGGTGRSLILLAGLGGHAHGFARFVPKLTPTYHVFSVTRRGFAPSSIPASGYTASRLGNDVVAVIDALKLDRPILAGHSLAGEELSAVGTHHPEKVAGLIYLDAGYAYALYDDREPGGTGPRRHGGDQGIGAAAAGKGPPDLGPVIAQLEQLLPRLEQDLRRRVNEYKSLPDLPAPPASQPVVPDAIQQIFAGQEKFTEIHVPILAIFAVPHDIGGAYRDNPSLRERVMALDQARTEAQIKAFERQVPAAHIVRLPHASHLVYESNAADVVREMNAFIGSLP